MGKRIAIIKYYGLGDLVTDIYFSQFWRPGILRSALWLLVRPVFLVCRWTPSCYVLTWQRVSTLLFSSCDENADPIVRAP